MGWVTLTLRKTELKRTHADYQMELLEISREKRQMARVYHYQQSQARTQGNATIREAQNEYIDAFKQYRDTHSNTTGATTTTSTTTTTPSSDGSSTSTTTTTQTPDNEREQAALALDEAKLKFERDKMEAQNQMEDQLAMLEQEANDIETMYDQEQVEVEAQLEAISAEIEAVGEAISSQIQASTIKLS